MTILDLTTNEIISRSEMCSEAREDHAFRIIAKS